MKKLLVLVLGVMFLLPSLSLAGQKFPSFISQSAVPLSNQVTPYVNDNKPWTAQAESYRYRAAGTSQSRSRVTADKSQIRDIDYIYVRCRGYIDTYLSFSDTDSDTNAADAYANGASGGSFLTVVYGTHEYKEAGYQDIFWETSY